MLSYHADADIHTNPFELGLDRLVNLEMEADFIGKFALQRIRDNGIKRKQVGLIIDGEPMSGPNTAFWTVTSRGEGVGKVSSAVYSPRLEKNIALAMVDIAVAEPGTELLVLAHHGETKATVVERPFYDPRKSLASTNTQTGAQALA